MFTGKNESGKMFDVINEEKEVIGSFDEIRDAIACVKSAPWYEGDCDIRRSADLREAAHASCMRAQKTRTADFYLAFA